MAMKEPWLAVNLSDLWAGLGQIYAGATLKGIVLIVTQLLFIILIVWGIVSPQGNLIWVIALFPIILIVKIINLFDAHKTAKTKNSPSFEQARKQYKDPWLAVFLSKFFPGIGHFYLSRPKPIFEGILWFFIALISSFFPDPWNGIGFLIIIAFAMYSAFRSTSVNRQISQGLGILIIVISSILIFLPSTIITAVEARYIPSSAMEPTLQINDRLLINKLSYWSQDPQRGDIIVFEPTETLKAENFNEAFIKRVIGLPGETVEVKDGVVYIDHEPLQEPYLKEPPRYTFGPVVVPQGEYFVLGDNRNDSFDSHYWGFVPRQNIIGKAYKRWFPIDRIGAL